MWLIDVVSPSQPCVRVCAHPFLTPRRARVSRHRRRVSLRRRVEDLHLPRGHPQDGAAGERSGGAGAPHGGEVVSELNSVDP